MQIVIEISEEDYINLKNAINSLIENGIERASMSKICLAILDGTPLPKGHGRLIDAAEVEKLDEALCATECAGCGVDGCFYDRAETIIEADRSEAE